MLRCRSQVARTPRGCLLAAAEKADSAVFPATLGELQERFASVAEHHGTPAQRLIDGNQPHPNLGDGFLESLFEKSGAGRRRFTSPGAVLASDLAGEVAHLFALYVGEAAATRCRLRMTSGRL